MQPFSTLKRLVKWRESDFFPSTDSDITRNSGFKLKDGRFRLDGRRKFFNVWVVRQ